MLIRNAGIIYYALFWNGNNGLQCAYFVNNDLRSASMNTRFFEYHVKWYKLYNNNLFVVLGSKLEGTLQIVNPKHEDWASIQLLALTLNVLVYFVEMPSYFSRKTKPKKKANLRNSFSAWKNFRVDLTLRMRNFCQFS